MLPSHITLYLDNEYILHATNVYTKVYACKCKVYPHRKKSGKPVKTYMIAIIITTINVTNSWPIPLNYHTLHHKLML